MYYPLDWRVSEQLSSPNTSQTIKIDPELFSGLKLMTKDSNLNTPIIFKT